MKTLYHYTCDHGHSQIDGHICPLAWDDGLAIGTPGVYAWFTDLAVPIKDALGLTSSVLNCDRTAHRYRVTGHTGIEPWVPEFRRIWTWGRELESAPGARPAHWYVATEPVPVVYDPRERP